MAQNIIVISKLNPLKFIRLGYENPGPYNTRYFEDWVFGDTIREFEQQVGHLQPWQKNDIIELCILSNYQPFNVELQDCAGEVVSTHAFAREVSSTDVSGLFAYRLSLALDTTPEGVYRLVIKAGAPTVLDTLISEWFDVRTLQANTFLHEYTHDENDFDVPFELDINFRARFYGGLAEYAPKVDSAVFIDQSRNAVQLSAKSYSVWRLFYGDGAGMPDWSIERANEIYNCSTVLVDGKQFTRNDGAQVEPNREKDFPMAGWSLEVRPAQNASSKRFVKNVDGEGAATSTLMYNIETRGFGPITSGGASDNTTQIISNE